MSFNGSAKYMVKNEEGGKFIPRKVPFKVDAKIILVW